MPAELRTTAYTASDITALEAEFALHARQQFLPR